MKKALGLLAVLLLAVQVYSQTQPVVYRTLSRNIVPSNGASTSKFLTNQRLPACYQADYLVSDITSISEGSLFSVLYVPRSDEDTPAPSSPVTIQFFQGTATAPVTPIGVSSVISDTVDSIQYISGAGGCSINDDTSVVRAPGNVDSGCGINYYCSGFTSAVNTRLWVRITTTGQENDDGILFDLAVIRGNVGVTTLTVGTTSTFTQNPATGDAYLKPTVAQKHYKVAVGPAGTSISQYADFLVRNNPSAQLRFTLSNLRVSGVAVPSGSSQGEWSLNVNFGDLASADTSELLDTVPSLPCEIASDSDLTFYQTSQVLEVIIPGCSVQQGVYYIDVAIPSDSTSYTYDLLVTWEPINDNNYIQSYKTLNTGVYVNDVVGSYSDGDARQQNVYLLNLSPSNFVTGSSYFFVTVFGVDFGSVSVEVTQGCFGTGNTCSDCAVVAKCNNWPQETSPDVARDYCKVKIDPCDADTTLPYFVTVRANPDDDDSYVEYSIQFDIKNTNVVDITTLSSVQGSGYVEYSFVGRVDELDYNHFVYNVPTSVNHNYHLTAQVYTNQEQDEILFTHNKDSLAGSGKFITAYYAPIEGTWYTYGPLESPYDDCYDHDYMCNTLYKDTSFYNVADVIPIASCTAVLPYCDIVAASKHYFSIYGVNSSPNSYWGKYYDSELTGYARSVEYTLVFRLYTQAVELVPGQVINSYVVQENYGWFWTSSNEPEYLSNWYTNQYVLNIPSNPGNGVYDNVRIVLGDVYLPKSDTEVQLYATCGSAAGECPCFSEFEYTCYAYDNSDADSTCQLYIPLCNCKGPIYISARALDYAQGFTYVSFTLSAFFTASQTQTLALPSTSATYSDKLQPNNDFDLVSFNGDNVRYLSDLLNFIYNSEEYRYFIYDSDLYVLPVSSVAANRGLEFTLRYTTTPGTTEEDQLAILSIARDVVPPSNPYSAQCSTNCIASLDGYSYCTIVLDPCQVESGNYYIRVVSLARIDAYPYAFYDYEDFLNILDFAGISYSLTVTQTNQAPVALTLGTPLRDSVKLSQYKHYSLTVPNQSNSALKVHLYRNADQITALNLYLNDASLAGHGPCYSYTHQCEIAYGDASSVCNLYIPICEFSSIAGKTIYLSVESHNEAPYFISFDELLSPISGFPNIPIQYTIGAQLASVVPLDLNRGAVMTGNVFKQYTDHYSYTVSQSDISAGKTLVIEVDSTQPSSSSTIYMKSTITTTNPANQEACPCADIENTHFNSFRLTIAPCELTAGTYYLSVKALLDGFNAPFDPISYTVKAFFTTPMTQSLSLSDSWTVAPKPLNFRESVVYSIRVTPSQNQVVNIEIADLPSTRDSVYANGINAYLNFGVPGSASCNIGSCVAANNEDPEDVIPAGTVMCRFTITPCTDCSGTYYLTVEADMIAPEPRFQYLSNYTVRAYTTSINTLENFPSNYRTNALNDGGYTFEIENTVNPTIQCDTRWGSPIFQDFFFRLPAVSINQYEQFNVQSLAGNANVLMSFSADVSPDRNGPCGCDALNGETCTIETGCETGVQSVTVYARVGLISCAGEDEVTLNGLDFNTEILADRVYTALAQQTVATNTPFTTALTRGQYIVLRYTLSSINFNLLPRLSFEIDLSSSGGSVADRTCLSYGTGAVAQTFPGSLAGTSYCELCAPMTSSTLEYDGCCINPSDVFLLTVYNPHNGPESYSFTFTASVEYDAAVYNALTLPITRTYDSVRSDIATTFSFTLSSDYLKPDDVLNFRIASDNGTAIAHINSASFAHSSNECADSFFSCNTNDQNCNFQFPPCYFAWETNGIGYNTYYVSIVATSDEYVGPVTVSIAVQNTVLLAVSSVSASKNVPDLATTPVDYMVHYKFQYPRSVGDALLSGNNVAVQVKLNPGNNAKNNLELSIADPRFTLTANPLAGEVSGGNPVATACDYTHDNSWECFSSDEDEISTRVTDGNVGVTCVLYFCDDGVPEPELAKLLSNQFVYVSVRNTDSSAEREPTPFTIGVSVISTSLPTSQVLYNINPSATTTDRIFNNNCTTGSNIDGGCKYVASSTVDTAYFSVNLANIGSWGVNDYLLVNFTNVEGSTLDIISWANDQCEPNTSSSDLTCNPGEECIIEGDPCKFTSLFRADTGANSYVTEARNVYIRVRGLTPSSTFSIAVLRVTPLQITVPLSVSSPSYSATFQSWEGRWTLFNFVLPKTALHDFTISITSECGTNIAPEVYLNEYSYQWASKSCAETVSATPFSWEHYSCELDGNLFVSVYTPIGSLKYDPIVISDGRVSPQVKFTVTASLNKVVDYTKYAWESEAKVESTANFEAIGDNENYGTGLSIRIASDEDGESHLMVVSPLYRESYEDGYGVEFPVPVGDWNTAFYNGANDFCYTPSCDDPGVYCCDADDGDCVINIPPCEYRNGRYFIYAKTDAPSATLSSRIYRQDYVTLDFSASTDSLTVSGTIPIVTIYGDNLDLHHYQYFEINILGDAQFLHVSVAPNVYDLVSDLFDFISYDDFDYLLHHTPYLRATLSRGDSALSTTSEDCSDYYCSVQVPGECNFGEVYCVSRTYYLAVWFESDFFAFECEQLEYDLTVSVRDVDPITILPDTTVCGTVQASPIDYSSSEESDAYKRDFFYRDADDDDEHPEYPTFVTYQVDLTGVNPVSDDVTITLYSIQSEYPEYLSLAISTTGPPSHNCADCSEYTFVEDSFDTISTTIYCGSYSELWITVSVSPELLNYHFIYDYLLEVSFTRFNYVAPTIPALTFGVPATVSIPITSDNLVYAFSTNNHQRALLHPDTYVSGTPIASENCADGCPEVEGGCLFLGAEPTYYVFFENTLDTDTACYEPSVLSFETIQVQSVRSWTIPSSGSSDISGVIPPDGYDLIYVTLPTNNGLSIDSLDFYVEVALQSSVYVQASCEGFSAGSGCSNSNLFTFSSEDEDTVGTFSYSTCGCKALYLTVSQSEACGAPTDYTLGVQVNAIVHESPLATLTNNVYVAATLPTTGPSYRLYSITATNDKFIHVSINRANNTATGNGHSLTGYLADANGCEIDSCNTGDYASQPIPERDDGNSEDSSCFLYTDSAVAGQVYYVLVRESDGEVDASVPSTITYRIKPIVNYVDLETTSNQNFQLVGWDRQYYKVNGRVGGSASGNLQSVVITLNIVDGDRAAIIIADSPSYIDLYESNSAYDGWAISKVCYFGQCTIEISTAAQHPGVAVFYVWVETVTTTSPNDEIDDDDDYRVEKQVNYRISASTGLNNCVATNRITSGFCASTVQSLSNVFSYRDLALRNQEAEARFNNLLCKCDPPTAACLTKLTRFSCLESFRECDSRGFWTPLCRYECELVEDSCGPFYSTSGCNECERPEFSCSSARYSDAAAGACTGVQFVPTPSPSPSTSLHPSGVTRTPTPTVSITPSPGSEPSSTSTPAPEVSPSIRPSFDFTRSNDNSGDVIIKYYFLFENAASSLIPSAFLIVFSILFFIL